MSKKMTVMIQNYGGFEVGIESSYRAVTINFTDEQAEKLKLGIHETYGNIAIDEIDNENKEPCNEKF